jgi:hypothetical protein
MLLTLATTQVQSKQSQIDRKAISERLDLIQLALTFLVHG